MKKVALLIAFLGMVLVKPASAQFDLSKLDNIMSLVKAGSQPQAADVLKSVLPAIQKQASGASGVFGTKILSQLGALGAIIPALSKGNANLSVISKIVSTLKSLFAAQALSKLMNGNKFTGNAATLVSGITALKSSLGGLGNSNPAISGVIGGLDQLINKAPKLDKSGLFAGFAKRMISKRIGSTLSNLGNIL